MGFGCSPRQVWTGKSPRRQAADTPTEVTPDPFLHSPRYPSLRLHNPRLWPAPVTTNLPPLAPPSGSTLRLDDGVRAGPTPSPSLRSSPSETVCSGLGHPKVQGLSPSGPGRMRDWDWAWSEPGSEGTWLKWYGSRPSIPWSLIRQCRSVCPLWGQAGGGGGGWH